LVARQVRDRDDTGAIGLLQRLRASAEDGGRDGVVVETLVLESLAHHALGDRAAAVAALDRALTLAEPERQLRVFLDQGAALTAILRSASFEGAAGVHAKRVLAASAGEAPTRPTAGLVDELSSRELDVLRLLRSELSGPEIARELIVSLNTMRTHTKNIYAKLGVTSRREAIRRADELGL
jgi:LuxR family maltose regulon positive regulatory protein